MAKTGASDNKRDGSVRKRSQVLNPKTNLWAKRDDASGKFMDVKTTGGKFKGVTREGLPAARRKAAAKKSRKASTKRGAAAKTTKKAAKKGARKKRSTS